MKIFAIGYHHYLLVHADHLIQARIGLIYNEIDKNPLFSGTAELEDRSTMNATFTLNNEELNEEFMYMLHKANISGLKGHRSVGGFRASMYNAMPLESVKTLVDVMQELTNKKG